MELNIDKILWYFLWPLLILIFGKIEETEIISIASNTNAFKKSVQVFSVTS